MKFKAGGLKNVDIRFKLVLGLKNYMIIVFMTGRYVIAPPIKPSCVLSQFLWYNTYIKIDNKAAYLNLISKKNINFISQLFNKEG